MYQENASVRSTKRDIMAFKHIDAIEVLLYGKKIGVVAAEQGTRDSYAFEYYPAWIERGFPISPLQLPLKPCIHVFRNMSKETWYGLPPAIADALPDHFGNALINAHLARLGVLATKPKQKLSEERLSISLRQTAMTTARISPS